MTSNLDLGGNDIICNTISTGATAPGQAGSMGAAQAQTFTGVKTFSANPAFTVGNTIKSNVAATTLTSNIATVTGSFLQCTTPSLTTAAAASQTEVITLVGTAAADMVFLTKAGGTNTRHNYQIEAVCTTDTVTVTIYNTEPTNALNGTIIFNVWVLKA